MALDNAKNFAKVTVSAGYDAAATSIVLNSGDGAKLPTPPFNLVWWNASTYPDPSDDPNVEIVRCTVVATDTLTITRAQESTSATTKNTAGKIYKMIAGLTAKVMNADLGNFTGTLDLLKVNFGSTSTYVTWNGVNTLIINSGADINMNFGSGRFLHMAGGLAGVVDISPDLWITQKTSNGAQWVQGKSTELLTLSTSATFTDTSANLLPANSIIEAVVARVTTTITVATDWELGDPTTVDRFAAPNATMTAGATSIGLKHQQGSITTDATGPVQTSADKVRVTTTGTPGAGVIRITVFYRQFVAPTS